MRFVHRPQSLLHWCSSLYLLLPISTVTSDTSRRPRRTVHPPPYPPCGHITHLLEQTIHKVAISRPQRRAGLQPPGRWVPDRAGSPQVADRQGGLAALRWKPRSPASSQGPTIPGRCVPSTRPPFHLPGRPPHPGCCACAWKHPLPGKL